MAICAGNSPIPGEFPAQRSVTRSFDVFFDLRLNKRLSKQWWGWWFETLSHPLWRHRNVEAELFVSMTNIVFELFFSNDTITVPERKFVTKIRVRYQDPRWRRQQSVMSTLRFLTLCFVFHVFETGYGVLVTHCSYVIPKSVSEFDKTAVNWCTKILVTLPGDLGNGIHCLYRDIGNAIEMMVTSARTW